MSCPTTQVSVDTRMEAAILAGVLGMELWSRSETAFRGLAVNQTVDASTRGDRFATAVQKEVESYDAIGDLLDTMLTLARWHTPVTVDVPMGREQLVEAVLGAGEDPAEYANPQLPTDVLPELERASIVVAARIRDETLPEPGMCVWCDAHRAEWANAAGNILCEDCARQEGMQERGERIAAGLALAHAIDGLRSAGLTQLEIRAALNDALRGPHHSAVEIPIGDPPVLSSRNLPEQDWWQLSLRRLPPPVNPPGSGD